MANFLRMAVTNVRNARAEEIGRKRRQHPKLAPREFRG